MIKSFNARDEYREKIRKLFFEKGISLKKIGVMFGVTKSSVYMVVKRIQEKEWKGLNKRDLLRQLSRVGEEYDVNVDKMIRASIRKDIKNHRIYMKEERRLYKEEKRLKGLLDFIEERGNL